MKYALTIILSLVFVISIMVACFAFVPMSARQVADAQVSSLSAETLYYLSDLTISDLTYYGPYANSKSNRTDFGLPFRKYTNYPTNYTQYTYFSSGCFVSNGAYTGIILVWYINNPDSNTGYLCYVAGNQTSANGFPSDGWYYGTYQGGFTTKTPLESDYFTDNQTHVLMFVNAPTFYTSTNCFNVLKDIFNPVSLEPSAPTYDSFVNINYLTVSKDGGSTQINDVVTFTNNLLLMELDNAYLYQETGTPYNYVTVKAVFNFEDDTSTTQMFNLFSDGILTNRYYLLLAAPHDIVNYYTFNGTSTTFMTRDCTSIELSYGTSQNVTVFSEEVNPTAFAHFQNNFTYLMRTGTMYQAFWAGNTYGVQNSRLSGNNLQTLLWSVFQFPFKILFGEYDNNISSDTYGEYVGGLFNVTILGLDMRAFILSVVSLCVVIGIIKIVLGLRGVKG